ncbi:hypothetical protein FOC4_g10008857 [Fusarium odoratissimum]|uniref:C2H2-type domain-containing protein n=1 Tax=Fusarium oxysporum f. sp. cubense (strain race 4) TaxID=2502994 RepID=N1RX09_FUSC4|nr:hypothetical protein FOC4_g10008857 [Fusarium odoratissimum]
MTRHDVRTRHQRSALTCSICHKTYSKAEHLQVICGRQFSRPDSVTRHQRTHARVQQQQQQDQDQQQPQDGWPMSPSMSDYTSIQSVIEQNQNHSITYEPMPDINGDMFANPALSNSELDMHLQWPDSEALLHSIITFDWGSLTLPPGSIPTPHPLQQSLPPPNVLSDDQSADVEESQDSDQLSPVNGSRDAIQSLSDMMTCLNVTSAAKSLPELNPAFLDSCLQAYFSHFNIYPILHRPTFVYRDCSPSLILNAIALGSLFIGTDDAGHGWTALLRHRGPYDSHRGVQLVLTALLGQCYAVMSEKADLKLTSQVFHRLGFNWANQNNLSGASSQQPHREVNDKRDWKQWAAEEVYHRALVGHYILDGQLSYLLGFQLIRRLLKREMPKNSAER